MLLSDTAQFPQVQAHIEIPLAAFTVWILRKPFLEIVLPQF